MKKILYLSLGIVLMQTAGCKKEIPDNISRPAPFVRYDHQYLKDTFTSKTTNHFGVYLFSHSGITDYKVWINDSLIYSDKWNWDDARYEQWLSVDVNFSPGIPATKKIISWIKDRRNLESTDTLRIDFLGGSSDPQKIRFNPLLTYGTVNANGRTFKTIKISNYTWLAQNASFTSTSGNTDSFVYSTFPFLGYYYNWNAAKSLQNPVGFQLPTKAHYDKLIAYLGGATVAGGALKEVGYGHWELPNAGATNSSGFTALGSGINSSGYIKQQGIFWTGTEYNADSAFALVLSKNSSYAELKIYPKSATIPVRVVSVTQNNVQEMLDNGLTPKQIINNGISSDSLLGKKYLGGRIFMFDYPTNKGMVMAENDLGSGAWCLNSGFTGATSSGYWTGLSNSLLINSGCGSQSVAAGCLRSENEGWKDWFLPSWYELGLAINTLKDRIPGYFPSTFEYWSSSEINSTEANYSGWNGSATTGGPKLKNQTLKVRAIRYF